jgi:hypothetical protein
MKHDLFAWFEKNEKCENMARCEKSGWFDRLALIGTILLRASRACIRVHAILNHTRYNTAMHHSTGHHSTRQRAAIFLDHLLVLKFL